MVGDKAAKRLDGALDLRTVGDLLRHYPRRYETRGELTDLASLHDGEHVTVQAEVASVTSPPDAQPAGHDLRGGRHRRPRAADRSPSSAAAGRTGVSRQLAPGAARAVLRPGLHLPRQAPARPPRVRAARAPGDGARPGGRVRGRDHPGLPGHQGHHLLADRRLGPARARRCWTSTTTRCRARSGTATACSGLADALRGIHRPADRGDTERATAPAEVGRGVRAAGGAGPAPPGGRRAYSATPRAARRRRPARRTSTPRLPFELTAGQQLAGADDRATSWPSTTRCTGCCRARSARARR